MLSRRELLAAFLGAPFAAMACRREPRLELPPGDIVGASHEVGHRLRTPIREMPNDWISVDRVIVGAGVAGLSAAWRLAQSQRDALVLELEEVAGGTARSGASRVSRHPWGAHYVVAPMAEDRWLVQLLREMSIIDSSGEVGEEYLVRDPQERIFYRGRWYEGLYLAAGASNEDLRQFHAFEREMAHWSAWRDAKGRRAFTIPTALASDDAEVLALDRMSMRDWLDAKNWHSPRLRWYVEYACRDDYGALLEDTSAWAGIFYFASRIETPGKRSEPMITFPEGNGRLVQHLAKSAKIETGWLVTSLIPNENGVDVIALSRDGRHLRGIHARQAIFAAPQFIASHVIRGFDRDVRDFTYGSWLVANLALRDRPETRGFPLAWDNVLYESPALGYVVSTHQSDVDYGPTGFTYYYAFCDRDPRVARERLLSANREQWAEVVLSDLARAHADIRALTERLDIMRWGHAMIRPHPGFITSAARRQAVQPFRNIHFANCDLSGIALFEESLWHGVRAAEEVLAM